MNPEFGARTSALSRYLVILVIWLCFLIFFIVKGVQNTYRAQNHQTQNTLVPIDQNVILPSAVEQKSDDKNIEPVVPSSPDSSVSEENVASTVSVSSEGKDATTESVIHDESIELPKDLPTSVTPTQDGPASPFDVPTPQVWLTNLPQISARIITGSNELRISFEGDGDFANVSAFLRWDGLLYRGSLFRPGCVDSPAIFRIVGRLLVGNIAQPDCGRVGRKIGVVLRPAEQP